jgi:Protein of unknown function (DUF4038)/Putative collagen-binding domain of a collagenase
MLRSIRLLAGITFAMALAAAPLLTPNRHYFVRDGKPFFWLGDTAWTISSSYTPEEAEEYLEHRARQGFTVINVMMVFTGGPGGVKPAQENVEGNAPFLNWNPATPNEAFFKNVDRVLAIARRKNLILAIMPCGGSSGAFVKKQKIFTEANVREYGRWLGRRYKEAANLIWVNGFDLKSSEYVEITEALAAGLREGDGGEHLQTFHPGGGNSSSYFQTEDWLSYNTIQTWSDYWRIHSLVLADYCRLPVKPVVLAEGAYEAGPEYPSRPITPLIVRKQAWWAYLGGGFHTYGHNDMWRKNPTWRESLDSPGARQMSILKQVLAARAWWTLVPDQSVIALGAGCDKNLNAAARSTRGDLAIVYLSTREPVSIDFGKITSAETVRATWVNPETGESTVTGVFANSGLRPFTPSLKSEDAVLLLEAVTAR